MPWLKGYAKSGRKDFLLRCATRIRRCEIARAKRARRLCLFLPSPRQFRERNDEETAGQENEQEDQEQAQGEENQDEEKEKPWREEGGRERDAGAGTRPC